MTVLEQLKRKAQVTEVENFQLGLHTGRDHSGRARQRQEEPGLGTPYHRREEKDREDGEGFDEVNAGMKLIIPGIYFLIIEQSNSQKVIRITRQ